MAVTIGEALYLLRALGVETVSVDGLIETFLQQPDEGEDLTGETSALEEVPEAEATPELPEPPRPPETAPESTNVVKVYKEYSDAKKAAQKGQKPVFDQKIGGYVLMEG